MLHGGDIRTLAEQAGLATDELLDCSASINPCGPPLWLRDVVARALDGVLHYPDPQCRALRAAAAARFGCRAGQVLPGAGTEALIDLLPRALGTTRMLLPIPCYNGYHEAARRNGCEILTVTGAAEQGFRVDCARLGSALRDGDLVICGHPANPGGQLLPVDELLPLMRAHRAVTFVIDEAFIELCDRAASLIGCTLPNVLVLRSLTKCFAIPGMRVGLAVGPEELVTPLADAQSSWSVGCVEEAVAVACLGDDEHLRQSRERLRV
ncbi:MAG: aminotransferase class I/II-fold pyridoxal phosphate-dependent enzyme, partial [Planctomycetota bacterium]